MKLVGATIHQVEYNDPHAETRPGFVLQIEDELGNIGQGEAAPLSSLSPDDAETAEAALRAVPWEKLPPVNLERPWQPQLRLLLTPLDLSSPSALFAAELALLDLLGQRLGGSLAELISGEASKRQVPLDMRVERYLRNTADTVNTVSQALDKGRSTVTLWVGSPHPIREVAIVRAIKRRFGERVRLRFEVLEPWDAETAQDRFNMFMQAHPEYILDPVSLQDIEVVPRAVPMAVQKDLHQHASLESLLDVSIGQREDLLFAGPAPLHESGPKKHRPHASVKTLVLHPMTLGGVLRTWRIAREAQGLGYSLVLNHFFDGPIAKAAYAELASCLPDAPLACGLDYDGNELSLEVNVPHITEQHALSANKPGLGLPALSFDAD